MTRQVKLLSSTEVAKIMGLGKSTVGNWFIPDTNQPPPAGMPEPVRIGRSWRWQERTIRAWIRDEWPQHPRHAQIRAHRAQIQPRKRTKPVEVQGYEAALERGTDDWVYSLPEAIKIFLDTVSRSTPSEVCFQLAVQLEERGK